MVDIVRDESIEKEMYTKCKEMLSRPRSGIHVSDLVSPRLAFLRNKYGSRISEEQAMYFIVGKAHHGLVQTIATRRTDEYVEKKTEFEDVIGSIDYTYKGHPVEFKSTRVWNTDNVPDEHVEQLRKYCAMERDTTGYLVTLYLNVKTEYKDDSGNVKHRYVPIIRVRVLTFTNAELEKEREDMKNNIAVLKEAYATGDASKLPKCAAWKCRDCLYKVECKEIDKPKQIKVNGSSLVFTG
jgi:hypothetical protein